MPSHGPHPVSRPLATCWGGVAGGADQAKASGKPDNVIDKMVEGRLRKFYEEVVLLEQPFIMDTDKKVKDIVSDASKELGSPVQISGYVVFKLGEGIQKKEDDFASEVSNLAK